MLGSALDEIFAFRFLAGNSIFFLFINLGSITFVCLRSLSLSRSRSLSLSSALEESPKGFVADLDLAVTSCWLATTRLDRIRRSYTSIWATMAAASAPIAMKEALTVSYLSLSLYHIILLCFNACSAQL